MRALGSKIEVILKVLIVSLLGFIMFGCGSATNNDQGTAISLDGFFAEIEDDVECDTLPAGLLGTEASLGDYGFSESPGDFGGAIFAIAGISNHLSQQAFRTERVLIDYYIEGASEQPPSTTVALSALIRPSAEFDATDSISPFDSSLPPSFAEGGPCSIVLASFPIVPPEIRAWVSLNRGSLPEAPFFMTAIAKVTGLSTAGDRYTTNEATFDVLFKDEPIIPPTVVDDGEDTGSDTTTEAVTEDTTFIE